MLNILEIVPNNFKQKTKCSSDIIKGFKTVHSCYVISALCEKKKTVVISNLNLLETFKNIDWNKLVDILHVYFYKGGVTPDS